MILLDVNVLIYAFRTDASPEHPAYKAFVEGLRTGDAAFGTSELILSGFLRIVTNPRVFKTPTTLADAIAFVDQLRDCPSFTAAHPGERHWQIFLKLCQATNAKGNMISDAYHAALALELGADFATADRDFTRFPGLKLIHPLG